MAFRLSKQQREIIRTGIDAGLSYSAVAERADCKMSTAKSYARRVRLQSPKTLLWDKQKQLITEGKCFCPHCKRELPIESFRQRDGRIVYTYCLDCCSKLDAERVSSPTLRFQRTIGAAKNRASHKGIPFDIDAPYLAELWQRQGGLCAYTGEPMTMMRNRRNTMSLDRVVPENGYIKGNVVLCCDIVNEMKWDMTDSELLLWCRKIVERAENDG